MNKNNYKEEELNLSLMERASNYRNIHLAYLRTKNNFMNLELKNHFEIENFEKNIPEIYDDIRNILLKNQKHEFKPLEVLQKPKKKKKGIWDKRPIARIYFFDAVVIQSIINILSEELRFMLPISNFGYRLNSYDSQNMYQYWKDGYSQFVNKEIEISNNKRFEYVIELDIKNFYPSIDRDLLLADIKNVLVIKEEDNVFIDWIEIILNLKAFTVEGEAYIPDGLPQGPLYSPLFALFYIRDYSESITNTSVSAACFSYVDDIKVYCETIEEAKNIEVKFSQYLKERRLEINKEKSSIKQINTNKKNEIKLMSKASNLDRALRDELIVSSKDKDEMKEKLNNLKKEIREQHIGSDESESKIEERLKRFVDYRLIKLLDNDFKNWSDELTLHTSIDNLDSNFVAMWHALYLSASTRKQKLIFIDRLLNLQTQHNFEEINYVEYIIQTYLLKWSPHEMKISIKKINKILDIGLSQKSLVMKKALLKNIHSDWIPYVNNYIESIFPYADEELKNLLDKYSHNTDFQINNNHKRLIVDEESVIHFTSDSFNIKEDYLASEKIKNINYTLLEQKENFLACSIDNSFQNISEINLSDLEIQKLLFNLVKWLDTQFNFTDERIPCSVFHPDYIYIKEGLIQIIGNPLHEEDIYYYHSPDHLWKKALTELIQTLYKIKFNEGIDIFNEFKSISLWKYRVIKRIQHKNFTIKDFISFILSMTSVEDQQVPISFEQISLNNIFNHYIKDFESFDKLLLISNFVENSWKNGAKECNFYTLHNHEHARYLIKNIHEIIMNSDFSIYLNSKEAFRLFAACYLHDIGMLSAPDNDMLNDTNRKDVASMYSNVSNILTKTTSRTKSKNKELKLPYIYDIHSEVEKIREGIVRDEHPNVSEKELVTDYPHLPLTVAERRDIGLISSAHGAYKSEINNLSELLHDENHPIQLKLLSLLLRLADLSDVSKDRVRKEIIERNYDRMEDESIFHWIKHLSVDNFNIEMERPKHSTEPLLIKLSITHNYLPTGNIPKTTLNKKCGIGCKFVLSDNGLEGGTLEGFYEEGKKSIKEKGCDFKYFEDTTCNLTCAFVNKSYNWFYAEIVYLNMYLSKKNINVQFDLNIMQSEHANKDFYYIFNRNEKHTAQEFMHNYFS